MASLDYCVFKLLNVIAKLTECECSLVTLCFILNADHPNESKYKLGFGSGYNENPKPEFT